MLTKAASALLFSASVLMLSACGQAGEDPQVLDSATGVASDAVVDVAPGDEATSAPAPASDLDTGALGERRDPERLLRYYVSAVREADWAAAAKAWSLDAQMTPEKLEAQLGGQNGAKLAVGKGDMEGAAGSLYYEAPVVVDFADHQTSKRGTIVLRRVNDVPGASDEQLNWRIERTSTLTQ